MQKNKNENFLNSIFSEHFKKFQFIADHFDVFITDFHDALTIDNELYFGPSMEVLQLLILEYLDELEQSYQIVQHNNLFHEGCSGVHLHYLLVHALDFLSQLAGGAAVDVTAFEG